jgi:peptide/nickel transport system substrate-binding protein
MTASRPQPITLALLVACAAGCAARDRRTPDDTVVLLVEARINSLDPRYTEANDDEKLTRLVATGLTSADTPDFEPRLLLAEAIEERDPLTVDVLLRPGLRFSDGSPLTAADVVFTFESALDPAMASPRLRNIRERFARVEALDERRVRFHLVAPLATIRSDLDFGIVSARAAGPGGRFRGGQVIGAGPFLVESFQPEEVRLRRNPRWLFGPPRVQRVRVRVVRDANARALMLVGGSADVTQNTIRIDLLDDLVAKRRVRLASGPGRTLTYLLMNERDPALGDVRVRRAIAYAIDRDRVVRSKLDGRAVLATGLLAPGHWAYNPDVEVYRHDPARARALLDQAGYPDPDGPGGRPRLRLTLKVSSQQLRLALARVWAAQLAEVGVAVEVQSYEFTTVFADYKKGNFQLGSLQTAVITEPDFFFTYFHSTRIPSQADPNAQNRSRYSDRRVDELTELGRRTAGRERRRAIYGEVQAILARDLPVIPLWHEDNAAVTNVDLRDYAVYPSASLAGLVTARKR